MLEKLLAPFKKLIDLKFIIPTSFLIISLIGNGVQCGKDAILKYWLKRTKNALELAIAKENSFKARTAAAEYRAQQAISNKVISSNDKKLVALRKRITKKDDELKRIETKVGKMDLAQIVNELKKELGESKEKQNENNKRD
jgi:hypothetical protein